MKLEHAAVMAAKDKRENDSQQRHSEALQRERDKRDRGVAVQNEHHLIALGNLRRELEREFHTLTSELQKQLGAVQSQVVQCELRQQRVARHAKDKAEDSRLELMSLRNEVTVVACLNSYSNDLPLPFPAPEIRREIRSSSIRTWFCSNNSSVRTSFSVVPSSSHGTPDRSTMSLFPVATSSPLRICCWSILIL